MNDPKPLRHEEYIALAEENRQLHAEVARLKGPRPSRPPPTRIPGPGRPLNVGKPDPQVMAAFLIIMALYCAVMAWMVH